MKLSISVSGTPCANGTTTTCRADLELDQLDQDADSRLYQTVRRCVQAVSGRSTPSSPNDTSVSVPSNPQGRSHPGDAGPRLATAKQIAAIRAIARRKSLDLNKTLQDRFDVVGVSELTIRQASSLIDELKSLQEVA